MPSTFPFAKFFALLWIALWFGACASTPPARLDDYHIVDCELPGQTIRIGTGMATTGRARALRTSANDCAVRGGYFVEPDQANYQTALQVWLPLAEAGDLNAQLYLGQIYEKGLGQAPDPLAAQRWYWHRTGSTESASAVSQSGKFECRVTLGIRRFRARSAD
jgi:hypothetical protein